MRRPPLITFLTYNRLGNTAISLPSLLRTHEDFELFLIDNDSHDDTWQFLNDTKDSRIKYRKRFEFNVGGTHALNFALTYRKQDQDWINYEYDYRITDKFFISKFRDVYAEYPEIGGLSATIYPRQTLLIESYRESQAERFFVRNGQNLYKDTIMGFCSFYPYESVNQFMYYDEVCCLLDAELNIRLAALDKMTGYAMDVHVTHTTHGGDCDTCLAYHSYCAGEKKCLECYNRIISKVTEKIGFNNTLINYNRNVKSGEQSLKCNSIFANNMSEKELKGSIEKMELFKKYSDEFSQNKKMEKNNER